MIATSSLPKRSPGSIIEARGRMWVVLPGSTPEIVRAKPLGASEAEETRLFPFMEDVGEAKASWPGPENLGRLASTRLLFRAARLATRSGAGPYRSLGKISIEPKPYQMVPLMMALRMSVPRLFIADDVGVGKTIEACLIAKELLERGEANGLAVLCPPHLCDQWRMELWAGFGIDAFILDSSSAARIERGLPAGKSVFDVKRHIIVSLDFIKSDKKRSIFAASCPNLVIVDEAHSCANSGTSARQQRHKLLRQLADDPTRSMLLLSATPHSGNELAFFSLISLLGEELNGFEAKTPQERESLKQAIYAHFVQRRRVDIKDSGGDFPDREIRDDVQYALSEEWLSLLELTRDYAKDLIERTAKSGKQAVKRVGEWTAIALLRCVASSPQAALNALENRLLALKARVPALGAHSGDDFPQSLLEDLAAEASEGEDETVSDALPSLSIQSVIDGSYDASREMNQLEMLISMAKALVDDPKLDTKVQALAKLLKGDLGPEKRFDGEAYSPVIFCRYVGTAKYVAERLREMGHHAIAVTGEMTPEERDTAIEELSKKTERRILVATDCLSEGVNLQWSFDAVVHYDLAWNPVRHEQREGRVDRLYQSRDVVRACAITGSNSFVDQSVISIISRKSREIRKELGILVPVPRSEEEINSALLDRMVYGERPAEQVAVEQIESAWRDAREGEKKNRAKYAQNSIKPEIAMAEWEKCFSKLGDTAETREFVRRAYETLVSNAQIEMKEKGGALLLDADLSLLANNVPSISQRLRKLGLDKASKLDFSSGSAGRVHISRAHPLIDLLSEQLREIAFQDATENSSCTRACVTMTDAVREPTVVAAIRANYRLSERRDENGLDREIICEETFLVGRKFQKFGDALSPLQTAGSILSSEEALHLVDTAAAKANINKPNQVALIEGILKFRGAWEDIFQQEAKDRAAELKNDHIQARKSSGDSGTRDVKWIDPAEPLALFVFLPENF